MALPSSTAAWYAVSSVSAEALVSVGALVSTATCLRFCSRMVSSWVQVGVQVGTDHPANFEVIPTSYRGMVGVQQSPAVPRFAIAQDLTPWILMSSFAQRAGSAHIVLDEIHKSAKPHRDTAITRESQPPAQKPRAP